MCAKTTLLIKYACIVCVKCVLSATGRVIAVCDLVGMMVPLAESAAACFPNDGDNYGDDGATG
jgi:hypothetical protein